MATSPEEFIEECGLFFESTGIPPMAGRVIGALLVADPDHRTLGELADDLGASMGSVSTMTRLLEQAGFLARVLVPGDRRTRYRIDDRHWASGHVIDEVRKSIALRDIGGRALAALPDASVSQRSRIGGMTRIASCFADRLPIEFDAWRAERGLSPVLRPNESSTATVVAGGRDDIVSLVEEFALVMEDNGLPRMAGRILGRLLTCDPAEQSLAELGDYLGASKGSISTMVRLLISAGAVERVGVPGDRRTIVRVTPVVWNGMMGRALALSASLRRLAASGLTVVPKSNVAGRRRIQALDDLGRFWEDAVPRILAEVGSSAA